MTCVKRFAATNADWSNIEVTFFNDPPPISTPTTIATFDLTAQDTFHYSGAHAADTTSWFEIIAPGGVVELMNSVGSDFDTEIGLYNADGDLLANNDDGDGIFGSLDGINLAAGNYFPRRFPDSIPYLETPFLELSREQRRGTSM